MLTVTRKPGETIAIGTTHADMIRVGVTSIRGERVRISVEAPPHLAILRSEHITTEDTGEIDALLADCSRRSLAKRLGHTAAVAIVGVVSVVTLGALGGVIVDAGKHMGVMK